MSIFKENVRIALLASMMVALLVFIVGANPSYANTDETVTEDQSDTDTETEEGVEETSLLPGDFFYFIKKLQENIMLVLTFDEFKEAELLMAYAAERTMEATVLYEQGELELGNETLQLAIDQLEEALTRYEGTNEEEINEEGTEEEEEVTAEEVVSEDPIRAELELKFASNLLALQTALEKVENPKAKEALAKNVLKAQERLAKKVEKKLAQLEKVNETEEVVSDEENPTEAESDAVPEEQTVATEDSVLQTIPIATVVVPKEDKKASTDAKQKEEMKKQEASKRAEAVKQKAEEKRQEATKRTEEAKLKAEEKRQEAAKRTAEAKDKSGEKKDKNAKDNGEQKGPNKQDK